MLQIPRRANNIHFVTKADDGFTKLGKNDPLRVKLGGAQHAQAN